MSRLQNYTRLQLSALSVAGPGGLRSLVRGEVEAGNLSGLTGTQIVTLGKDECVALLLGEAESATVLAKLNGNASTNGGSASTKGTSPESALAEALRAVMGHVPVDEAKVRAIVAEAMQGFDAASLTADAMEKLWNRRPVEFTVIQSNGAVHSVGKQHKCFPELLAQLEVGNNVWLVGPAGSGKTTAAENAAKSLGLDFYFTGAVDSEHKLLGFIDAQGRVVRRPFREAWEKGGVFLFDEVDASMPSALLAFNAALANGVCDFPDGCIPKHKDFVCIAGGNVWNGATSEYVGRAKQDAAFLDRFVQLEWSYDEALEREIAVAAAKGIAEGAGKDTDPAQRDADEWVTFVQSVRGKAKTHGQKVVISPRASANGAKLLAAGKLTREQVVRATLRKGMEDAIWARIA